MQYRLNGVPCLIIAIAVFYFLPNALKCVLYENYYSVLFGANILGLTASFALFWIGGKEKYSRCVTIDQVKDVSKLKEDKAPINPLARFYLGSRWNPRYLGIDLKMLLYLIGAVTLQLVILSGL